MDKGDFIFTVMIISGLLGLTDHYLKEQKEQKTSLSDVYKQQNQFNYDYYNQEIDKLNVKFGPEIAKACEESAIEYYDKFASKYAGKYKIVTSQKLSCLKDHERNEEQRSSIDI